MDYKAIFWYPLRLSPMPRQEFFPQGFPLPWSAMRAYRLYFAQVRARWYVYAIGVAAVALTNLTEVLQVKFVQWFVDLLSGRPIPESFARDSLRLSINALLAGLLLLFTAQALVRRLWRLSLGQETHRTAGALRYGIWNRARFFPRSRLQTDLGVGQLMNAATSDVSAARLNFGWTIIGGVDSVVLTGLAAWGIFGVNRILGFYLMLPFLVVPFITYRLGKRELQQHGEAQGVLGEFNDLAAQAVGAIKLQRLTQTGGAWTKRLMSIADVYRLKRLTVVNTSLNFVLAAAIPMAAAYSILFWVGMGMVRSGAISPGQFIAVQGYLFLLNFPMAELGFIISEWQRGIGSLERLAEIYRVPPAPIFHDRFLREASAGGPVLQVRDAASLGGEAGTLSPISFELKPGDRLGITGPVGSGKSTLVSIIAGLNHGFSGEVLFHGVDIRSWSHAELSRRICIVEQKPFLFADTVRNNVTLDLNLADGEIWPLLKLAAIDEEVRALPHGLDTQLGEWGINLSGGQKQRLTLARALARTPEVLLMDDCLSAVDTATEDRILKNLNGFFKTTTLIWTAHRSSTLRYCGRVLEIKPRRLAVNE